MKSSVSLHDESSPNTLPWLIRMNQTRRVLLAGLMIALTSAAGFALSGVPNVEVMTLLVFVAGYLLGVKLGMVVGAAAMLLHSLFNPHGPAHPPLLAAQLLGFAIIGLSGAVVGPRIAGMQRIWWASAVSAITGGGLTVIYQLMVNVASFYTFAGDKALAQLPVYIWAGMAFTVMHLVWNIGVFLVSVRPMLSVLSKYRMELK